MLSYLALVASFFALSSAQQFGPYYSLGATNSYIIEATTTLTPSKVPSPAADRLALWPGMGTNGGGLYQSIVLAVADPESECGGSTGQWCAFASVYNGDQVSGDSVPVDANTPVTINYKYDESTESYTQKVTVDGELISTITTSDGKAIGWVRWFHLPRTEDACNGTSTTHTYTNTTIVLAEADSSFGSTLAINLVTASELTSEDNITWTVESISVPEYSW
ncbi:uncharacterized protein EV420DRAFT_1483875 [Desarmillaria tabescens]|uniref:Concanavalin A-like lectin/glucanase n=1 Tax=Armillaria tabescens TaxID=1929756 RepID=A0AA39MUS0_ARMTA|nr:uncharacterized protein EV420DRAFT_1483875 [Desarmillaria tabescens]KAK0446973.1 hypothetical protein EV420DRAFT_1483875 [Desarmillaria tabescens]